MVITYIARCDGYDYKLGLHRSPTSLPLPCFFCEDHTFTVSAWLGLWPDSSEPRWRPSAR